MNARVIVDATGASNGVTFAQILARGMRPIVQVDATGVEAVSGATLDQLRSRGLAVFCQVDQTGTDPVSGLTVNQLAQRGILGLCPLDSSGIAQNGSLTADELAARGINPFTPTDETGTVKTIGGIILSNRSIAENSANASTLGTANLPASYTGTPVWSLTDTSGTFQINSSTGVITVLSNAALNYEVNTSLPITIAVSGMTPSVPDYNVSITITNVIEIPVNTVAPSISGTANVGNALSVSNGTWTDMAGPGSATYAYQWNRGGVAITGETASSYTLVHADAGTVITCDVTATNTAGSGTPATSSGTSNVTEVPSNTVAPSISGTAQVGSTLTASAGTWNGYPAPTPSYQWNADGVAISGETASTYVPVSGDVGKTITVTVTETNTVGAQSATSAATSAVTSGPTIALSANQDIQGAAQGTTIGTVSGGTGPYTVTDATSQTQMNVDGVTLEVGSVAPPVGSVSITLHDTGTPAAPDNTFTINTVPQAPALTLDASSDSGTVGDNITNDSTPAIVWSFGTLPVAGDVITRSDGATYTLQPADISAGTFSFTGASALSDGVHSLTGTHTRGTLTSAASAALSLTIDTTAPVLSSPTGTQTGSTTADLSVATDTTAGTMDWFVDTTSTAPTDSAAFATRLAAATASGSAAAVSTSPFTASATGLTAATTYYAYFLQTDVAANKSNIAAAASFTTAAGTFSLADLALDGWWSSASSTVSNAGSPSFSITGITDASGNGNSLTVSGVAPTFGTTGDTQNGKTVIRFSGGTGRLFSTAAFALSGTAGNKKNCSILWIGSCVTYTSAPRAVGFNVSGSDGGATGAVLIYHPDATEMKIQNGGATKADTGTGALVAGTMAVVIATWDGTNSKLYVNGVLKSTVANAPTFADSFTSLDIGSNPTGGNALNGRIAEIGVVGRVLTSTEISNIQTWAADAANWAI